MEIIIFFAVAFVIPCIIGASIIRAKSNKYRKSFEELLENEDFNPDKKRIDQGGAVAVDKDTEKIYLFGHKSDAGKLYDFTGIKEWELREESYQGLTKTAGVDSDAPMKWCIEFYTTDPENPRHEVWFGGNEKKARDFFAYLKSLIA